MNTEAIEEFPYLSWVTDYNKFRKVDEDDHRQIALASRVFITLCKLVSEDKKLSLAIKRRVYMAYVLSVLLYGAECWTLLMKYYRKVNTFQRRCIRKGSFSTYQIGNSVLNMSLWPR